MNLLRTLLTSLPFLILATAGRLVASEPPQWSLVRINVPDAATLASLWETGLDPEGSSGKPGGWMEFVAGPQERNELSRRGIAFEVVTPDLAAEAAAGLHAGPMDALGFGTGSMGGYYTLDEIGDQLDSMRLRRPDIVSAKQEFNYSVEGRPVWVVRISDDPEADDPSEPEVLYTALTHAREPAGMMTVLHYMWWLIEHYDDDARARYLVDNRQLWFIPVINPDGYRHNQATNPAGGGMWRKNRRENGDGTRGIDLNRNYGPYEMWNAPNGGSSTTPASDTYRGPSPFSEPETQTIDSFLRLHRIGICLNYHTYGGLLVYPWGCWSSEGPDSLTFREFAFGLTRTNRYAYGTDQQTVNYSTRGNSDDYMYGDTTKFRTFAMTPEAGASFWPASGQILPIAAANLEANITSSLLAGAMPVVVDLAPAPGSDTAGLLPGAACSLIVRVRNAGLDTARALTLSIPSLPGLLSFPGPAVLIDRLPPRSDTTITVTGMVSPSATVGERLAVPVRLTDTAGYDRTDTGRVYTGRPTELYADGAEEGMEKWIVDGSWGASTSAHGGSLSFTDSPAGASLPLTSSGIRTAAPIELAGYAAAGLSFWTRWAIEPSSDFGVVRASTDSGSSWTTLEAGFTNPASGSGRQTPGTYGFDGYTPGPGWVRQQVDLTTFAGKRLLVEFRLETDASDQRDGWYLDDIAVTGYRTPIPGGPVVVTSAGLDSAELTFGEWPGATDGVDPWLGESGSAPPPSPGDFDARWILPGTDGTISDYRDTLSGDADANVFTIAINASPADFPLTVRWDRTGFPPGAWSLTDTVAGHPALLEDMWRTDSAVIREAGTSAVRITHTRLATATVRLAERWGLVSLPVAPPDPTVASLFPGAGPTAWSFPGSYVSETEMAPGDGYWLLSGASDTVPVTGVPVDRLIVGGAAAGWRLIGSIYCPVPRLDACPDCPTAPMIYGYRNGYFIADTLFPGEGYWYRGTHPLILDCRSAGRSPAPPATLPSEPATAALTFVPPSGEGGATVRFGIGGPATDESGVFRLPPLPPAGMFDARFETENSVEYFEEGTPALGIRVSETAGDVSVRFSGSPVFDGAFSLETSAGGMVVLHPLSDGSTITVRPGTEVRLLYTGKTAMPGEFRVEGNFPNPFNPRTTISFDLPWPARISLLVRNVAGQEVDLPVSGRAMSAGRHRLSYDARSLPSGVYFYSLTAEPAGGGPSIRHNGSFVLVR